MECIFCKIIKGEILSKKIYEDEKVLAFLDINPMSPGHTLIIPKKHTLDIQSIDKDELIYILGVVRKLSIEITDKMMADGYSIIQNNGIAQDVKHFHIHIIPRYKNKIEMDTDMVYKKITQG